VINYSSALSLLEKGTAFLYIKSTYKEINPETQEYLHYEDKDIPLPILSVREQEAVDKLLNLCYCNPKRLVWIHHADILNKK